MSSSDTDRPSEGSTRHACGRRRNIAVIGSGVAGLTAAWACHTRHDVTVFESDRRIGGHSHTVEIPWRDRTIPVDTGFIVYNERTYPNLIRLFDALDVETEASEMSFAVTIGDGRREYSGGSVLGLFAQRRNVVRPSHYRMIADILRFYREAPRVLDRPANDAGPVQSLGDYLTANRYSEVFIDDHLLPMGSAIWSCSIDQMLDFPIASFVRFFVNHGLLNVADRPVWRTVTGGSRAYLRALTAGFADRIKIGVGARSIARTAAGVVVHDSTGNAAIFDDVIVAAHADQALGLLSDPTDRERDVLGAFTYQRNHAFLHQDPAAMPRRQAAWASWNYAADGKRADRTRGVSVTYWMNRLQNIDPACQVFVTLNPLTALREDLVLGQFEYDHPVFDAKAIAAQRALPTLQGHDRLWFCGSYCGYGFHEDAMSSGLAVARALGAPPPWRIVPTAATAAIDGTDGNAGSDGRAPEAAAAE